MSLQMLSKLWELNLLIDVLQYNGNKRVKDYLQYFFYLFAVCCGGRNECGQVWRLIDEQWHNSVDSEKVHFFSNLKDIIGTYIY